MGYAKVSLQKNGLVSPLMYTPNIIPMRPIRQDRGYGDMSPYYQQQGGNLLDFDFQKQIVDPINNEISGAIKLHQVDLTVAVIGLLLIVVSVSAIVRPLTP